VVTGGLSPYGLHAAFIADRLCAELTHMPNAITTARYRIERAWERGHAWSHKLVAQIRPGVSLLSGSVFVLLTLFLPIGYEACGPPRTGYEMVAGKGDWPTFLGVSSSAVGRDFYMVVLLLASCTLLLILVSGLRPGALRNKALVSRLALLAGTVSLFLVCDVTLLLAAISEDQPGLAALIPLVASCLCPGVFWPRKGFIAWVSVIASTVSLLFILDALGLLDGRINWVLLATEAVYAVVPLGLWYTYGFSSRPEGRARWEIIRRGLVAFYVPAVLGNFWFLGIAVKKGLWGFVPCYFGIHLIALGYLRLKQEPMLPSAERTSDQA